MIDLKYKDSDNNWQSVFYPIGSFYFSTISTSPASTIGGTWSQVSNAALRGIDSGEVEYVGSDTHTLTVNEMPRHGHSVTSMGYNDNSSNVNGHGTYWGRMSTNDHPPTAVTGGGCAFNSATLSQLFYLVSDSLNFEKVLPNVLG